MRDLTSRLVIMGALMCGTGAAGAGDIYCNNQGHDCSDRPTPGATMVRSTAPAPRSARTPAKSTRNRSRPGTCTG